ncbi:hypothetical protein EW145_g3068 [Phellinidium pouzarii]|uniref:protein-L-isoaspartate(D-aspartate) O-methyltransferase n=1 Tax=Phellinidium pouzarii TaxID=167371 RepID=A0A4S4LDY7_9AGAM|nr:hypothetical protein EW145_g3068 [Phellinidium pouzarii]
MLAPVTNVSVLHGGATLGPVCGGDEQYLPFADKSLTGINLIGRGSGLLGCVLAKLNEYESLSAASCEAAKPHTAAMAYLCSAGTNDQLVQNMASHSLINNGRVAAHAEATKSLFPYLEPGARVLDIGSGSGFTLALFHHLVNPSSPSSTSSTAATGTVVGIEHMPELVTWSSANLARDGLSDALSSGSLLVVCGDGREGCPAHAPYDAIHVGAAAPTMPPALIDQLRSPGRMFIPIGVGAQKIIQVDKDGEGRVTQTPLLDVMIERLRKDAEESLDLHVYRIATVTQ